MKRCIVGILVVLFQSVFLFSEVKLPSIFSNRMVLQQEKDLTIWGWADPKEKVTVEFSGQSVSTEADEKGKWKLALKPLKAGGPFTMKVNSKTLEDILVGEVWLASGQSNMTFNLANSLNGKEEARQAKFPDIRVFSVNQYASYVPRVNSSGKWEACSPNKALNLSAVAYYYAKELHQELKVPIGIIEAGFAGSQCQDWIDRKAFLNDPILEDYNYSEGDENQAVLKYCAEIANSKPEFKEWYEAVKKAKAAKDNLPPLPNFSGDPKANMEDFISSGFYNSMIYPIMFFPIKGVIWYQGEGNCGDALYKNYFEAMINNWRKNFEQGDFPFLFVQIANMGSKATQPEFGCRGDIRNEQRYMLKMKNTAMAVTVDIGDADNVHAKNKKDVGHRLALAAFGTVYGKNIVYSGPLYDGMKVEGEKAIISFKHTGTGMIAKGGDKLKGFAVAGGDGKFIWGDAKIDGNTVVVTGKGITKPFIVRYAMEGNPDCNLYNKEGLPASTFSTADMD